MTDSVAPDAPDPLADAMPCGDPTELLSAQDVPAGCTRLLGSLHLPDIFTAESLANLSSLVAIDGSLSLFRNHTPDFGALRNLRRVGTKFQVHMTRGASLVGFESLSEVGELEVPSAGELTTFEWLPALRTVREVVAIRRDEALSHDAVMALVNRLDVGGAVLLSSLEE